MTTEAQQEIAAGLQRIPHVEAGNTAAGPLADAILDADDDHRAIVFLDNP